jgi:phage tail sheath protein FI
VSPDGSARIRRLLNYIEQSIDKGTEFAVFEPNDERLWESVQRAVENFLRTVWRSGVLQGTRPDEAYFVRCDRTTMTQDDLDNGRLVLLVGVAPVKPAEFEILRISKPTGDVPQG